MYKRPNCKDAPFPVLLDDAAITAESVAVAHSQPESDRMAFAFHKDTLLTEVFLRDRNQNSSNPTAAGILGKR